MSTKINKQVLFKRVVETLKQNPYGLSSSDLSRILGINRMTLVKYLVLMQNKGIIEFKNIGMAKVWHTSSKYDLINMITKDESGSLQALVAGRKIAIRDRLDDKVPLSLFRAVKATLALTQDAEKALYEAGEFFAKKCLVKANIKDVQLIIQEIQKTFENLEIGIISPLQITPTRWILRLEESATAYGTIVRGNMLCHFEAGVIAGIIENSINKKTIVKETNCIGTGHKSCEFVVQFSK
jgi:uncharacterized protein